MRRAILISLVAALATPAHTPAAHAAPYDLELQSCIATEDPTLGCSTTDPGLRAHDVVVSPDGRNVYLVGWRRADGSFDPEDGKLIMYARNGDGSLRYVGCFTAAGGSGCGTAVPALLGAQSVAISADGRSVYVAARGNQTSAHPGALLAFDRASDGTLTRAACLGSGSGDGCAGGKAAFGLRRAIEVAVSPAGDRVVVGGKPSFLVDYRRDADGALTWNGCLNASGGFPCRPEPALRDVSSLAFNSDGRDLYTAGFSEPNSVVDHLARDEGGDLVGIDCISQPGGPCARTSTHVRGALGVAVTPDDAEVYVAAIDSGALTRFLRGPGGRLSEFGCANRDGADGCAASPTNTYGLWGVAASPDGSGVYAGIPNGKLLTYARQSDPGIAPIRCQHPRNCDRVGINGPDAALAFSPDGANLYFASVFATDHLLSIYRRPRAPLPEETTVPPGGLPIRPPLMGGIGMLRGRLQFTLDKAATVTISLSRVLTGRLVRGRCVRRTRGNARRRACTRLKKAGKLVRTGVAGTNSVSLPKKLAAGSYRATLIAVTGGLRSPTKTTSFRLR